MVGSGRVVRRDIPPERGYWMTGIELVNPGCFVGRLPWRKQSPLMQVIRRDDSSRQRPFVLFTPVPADKDAAFRSLVRITSTHDKDSDRRFTIDSVIRSLEPAVKPAQLKLIEVDCGLGTELGFAGIAAGSSAVGPGAHNQALQALLVLAESDVVQVCNLRTPGVIPAVEVIDGDVLVLGYVLDHVGPGILPEGVVIAVGHSLDQPLFILGVQVQR